MLFSLLFLALLSSAASLPQALTKQDSKVLRPAVEQRQCSLTPTNPSTYWYESIKHNGISPVIPDGSNWPVFRSVKSFGAKGDGVTDDSDAFQAAINQGNSYADRSQNLCGTTGQPAVVYIPKGVYVLAKPIQMYVGMIIMGDPTDRPTIKASSNFDGNFVIYGKDPSKTDATINFYLGLKNVIIDSTAVNKDKSLTLLDWSVSQNTQLANVRFQMPYDSSGHTGIAMPEGGSGTIMEDLYFHGGVIGLSLKNQQYHLKSMTFDGCSTAIRVSGSYMANCQGCIFLLCGVGVDTTHSDWLQGLGTFIMIDSSATSTGVLINTVAATAGYDSIVLENVQVDGSVSSTVTASGNTVLKGSVAKGQAWVYGNTYSPGGPNTGVFETGKTHSTVRASSLVDGLGSFYRFAPPTYQEYGVDQFINVKDVAGLPVAGDGTTDDTANLQKIINQYAGCKILFFPYGIYLVSDTLFFPIGSRVFGEAWSQISATGSRFWDPTKPVPMVKVGNPGDVGVAQFNDMLLTVADVLQGCILLEVNMAGANPGDVAFHNTHFRVGGANGSKVWTNCGGNPDTCKAAFMLAHFTSTSSAYVDNMWAWVADHDLDGGHSTPHIAVGRGVLIESTKPLWFLGFAVEHSTLYQVNINNAQNVFIGFQQSEAPYWQGNESLSSTPDPWYPVALASDPDFSWCGGGDAQCRMALYQRISGSKHLSLYAGGFWTFYNNNNGCSGDCQNDAVRIDSTTGLYYFGIGGHLVRNLVVNNNSPLVTHSWSPGGWGTNAAAFLADSQ
ncbi:glycoside hydrolase family 55 protein [Pseudomassariella vexata]|uniref:Glycoside hydrolase family 55 protein n=1 Tax=Pseudomassariella vexata TaxID=1141098 RepID=A0A1Y2DZ62_9PEZI|nr:glycoside hydrolase family 55 protein [Pseudomassariella vexata]ORY64384.1 glycoside hydrolase family 55 protein [Pseudomassariella vexata]